MDNLLTESLSYRPDIKISSKQVFGTKTDIRIPAFSKKSSLVPKIDKDYVFDNNTTVSILTGFSQNKRVLVQGYHGTGKTTHIEQIAARLNWPCVRINLDSHSTSLIHLLPVNKFPEVFLLLFSNGPPSLGYVCYQIIYQCRI